MRTHAYILVMNHEEAKVKAGILKALSHPVRIIIVSELRKGDRCGLDLLPLVGRDQSVLSRHLACLKNAGIVTERRQGVKIISHLECKCILDALDCTLGVIKADLRRKNKIIRSKK